MIRKMIYGSIRANSPFHTDKTHKIDHINLFPTVKLRDKKKPEVSYKNFWRHNGMKLGIFKSRLQKYNCYHYKHALSGANYCACGK